jgi:hypothetical protein
VLTIVGNERDQSKSGHPLDLECRAEIKRIDVTKQGNRGN